MKEVQRESGNMSQRVRWFIEVLLLASVAILLITTAFGGSLPSTTALGTFETLRGAETSGANIGNLVSQYNTLLSQSANDSSFSSLRNQALALQQTATSARILSNTITMILVPVVPFFLATLALGIVRLSAAVGRRRKMDMEIETS